MLALGTHHTAVPRDLKQNLAFRRHILKAAEKSEAVQRALHEVCRHDVLFFINAFCWTYDPRRPPGRRLRPFITFECQEKAIVGATDPVTGKHSYGIMECIRDQKDGFIEKSRDMGASWICIYVDNHGALFEGRSQFFMISRNKDAVDRSDDPDSLFWKIDFCIEHLPTWMVGAVDQKPMLRAFENGSRITGQATTENAGVGGRCTAAFFDEFSKIRQSRAIYADTADTTNCRIFNGTHTGTDSMFFELSQRSDIRKIRLHWSMHPDKARGSYQTVGGKLTILDKSYIFPPDYEFDLSGLPGGPYAGIRSPWYDEQVRKRRDPRSIAMNLDIDPQGASSQVYDMMTLSRLISEAVPYSWRGDLEYSRDSGEPIRLVESEDGPLRLWLTLTHNGCVPYADYAAGVDISNGTGATPSTISIGDAGRGVKVAEYANAFILPDDFARLTVALCRLFRAESGNGAALCWEQPGPGIVFGNRVLALGYRNIYYHRDNRKVPWAKKRVDTPGWPSNQDEIIFLHSDYREGLFRGDLTNRSARSLSQLKFFVYVDDVPEHSRASDDDEDDPNLGRESHGDIAIADALMWKMAKGKCVAKQAQETAKQPEKRFGTLEWRMRMHEDRRRERELGWSD